MRVPLYILLPVLRCPVCCSPWTPSEPSLSSLSASYPPTTSTGQSTASTSYIILHTHTRAQVTAHVLHPKQRHLDAHSNYKSEPAHRPAGKEALARGRQRKAEVRSVLYRVVLGLCCVRAVLTAWPALLVSSRPVLMLFPPWACEHSHLFLHSPSLHPSQEARHKGNGKV